MTDTISCFRSYYFNAPPPRLPRFSLALALPTFLSLFFARHVTARSPPDYYWT